MFSRIRKRRHSRPPAMLSAADPMKMDINEPLLQTVTVTNPPDSRVELHQSNHLHCDAAEDLDSQTEDEVDRIIDRDVELMPSVPTEVVSGFPCRVCDNTYSSSSNRARHERKAHQLLSQRQRRGKKRERFEGDLIASDQQRSLPLQSSANGSNERMSEPDHGQDGDVHAGQADANINNIEGQNDLTISAEGPSDSRDGQFEGENETNHEYEAKVLEHAERDRLALKDLSRPMLTDAEMQQAFFPFLVWLSQPPINTCEALVKVRRVSTPSQLLPIKLNLRFIFSLLHEREVVREVSIDALAKPFVCKSLFEAMVQREVGSARVHVLFLLIKKALVYLSSKESIEKKQFIQPSAMESYFYVESICADHGHKRKQEARNRALLGVEESRTLARSIKAGTQGNAPEVFEVPTTWSTPPRQLNRMTSNKILNGSTSKSSVPIAKSSAPSHRPVGSINSKVPDRCPPPPSHGPTMTKDELQKLTKYCLQELSAPRWSQPPITHAGLATERDTAFVAHLVTATLCLGLAPRSQVLQQLQIGSSLEKNTTDGRYWIRMLAEMSKNGKPTVFALPIELTPAYDLYLEVIRPRMLTRCAGRADGMDIAPFEALQHQYVFFKRNGHAPRPEFSSMTTSVTQKVLGRPINAHAFRAAVITTYYEAGASQSEMDTLATIMAHDPSTARSFYFRPQFNQVATLTNERMSRLLLSSPISTSKPPAAGSTEAEMRATSAVTATAEEESTSCSMIMD